jgi:hypothetical protein
MDYFFGVPEIEPLLNSLLENGWDAGTVDVMIVPTMVTVPYKMKDGTSTRIKAGPPVISLAHNEDTLPLRGDTPLMRCVGLCLQTFLRLPSAVDIASAPDIAHRNNAPLVISAAKVIEHFEAFQATERAAATFKRNASQKNWEARLKAEWIRFQLSDEFSILPCDEQTFRAIFDCNGRLKEPLPFLESYRHYWQSKQANLDDEQPSDFAIAVAERCVNAGIAGKWENDIAGDVIRALNVHPLHTNIFHHYVEELVAISKSAYLLDKFRT